MKTVNREQFEEMTHGAEVLAEDRHGVKVLSLPSGDFVKLFRRKRLISSAALWPYAARFAHAARELEARDVPTVKVLDIFRVKDPLRDVVCYQPLDGQTLREAIAAGVDLYDVMERFIEFFARLHASGVYFRAIHAANVIVRPDASMGLIDISEARFRKGPLGIELRARNFRHLVRYEIDTQRLAQFGVDLFFRHYIVKARMSGIDGARLVKRLARLGKPFEVQN